jgi:hypothetical protein
MLCPAAPFHDGAEGGIAQINARERAGTWKVNRACVSYIEDRRLYHRKEGEIVKLRDDVLAAGRYAYMMRRRLKSFEECDPRNPVNWGPPVGGVRRGAQQMPATSTSTCSPAGSCK